MIQSLYRHVLIPAYESGWHRRGTFRHLRSMERSQWLSTDEQASRQLESLRQILTHATATCPYYAGAWQAQGLDARAVLSLADYQRWPLIDRDTIRANRLQMRSTRKDLRTFAKATGGSSGVPLQFEVDFGSNDRKMAAWHRGYGWAGAGLGTKQFYLWGTATGNPPWLKRCKDELYQRLYRRKVVSCFGMRDDRVEWYLQQLNEYRPEAIVAYTNPLYFLARALEERGLRPWQPESIVVGAEKLHTFQRDVIERVFQAPVFETYGSREFMLIGAECSEHAGLHVTTENMLVEVLDDEGHITPSGEEGNVVITDLTNYGMPFIRYLNGDRAVAGFKSCKCGRGLPLLGQIVGRRLDTLRTPDGRLVPGEFFPHFLKDFVAVRRFQVVQHALDHVELKLVRGQAWAGDERQSMTQEIQSLLGEAVKLEITEVDEIPLTAAGKLRVVVSHCADEKQPAGTR